MFEFLKTVDVDQAIGGAYYAMRLIKRRADFKESKNGRSFEWILAGPSPDKQELALKIIHAIEQAEKRPLTSLSDSTVEKYIHQFSDIALKQVRKELTDNDMKRGDELLKEMRQSGVSNSWYLLNSSAQRSRRRAHSTPLQKRSKSIRAAGGRA